MRIALLATMVTFALDQASKLGVLYGLNLLDRGEVEVFPPYIVFHMAWNRGVNFGLFTGESQVTRWILIAIALAISTWVWLWVRRDGAGRMAQIACGLLVGGALGNVVDRLAYGAVADFLNMSCCGIENPYSFNIADVAIFAGALALVLFSPRPASGPGGGATRTKRSKVRKHTAKTP
ncbi:MAG: signal peptidase II [Paracoccaceae bacterium]